MRLLYSLWTKGSDNAYTNSYELDASGERYSVPIGNDEMGYGNFYGVLSSKLATMPFGLGVIFRTSLDNSFGAVWLEDTVIDSYNISVASTHAVMYESLRFMSGFIKPMNVAAAITTSAT